MAFPPNYRQERNNRDRAKQQKAAQKQAEREQRAAERKNEKIQPADSNVDRVAEEKE
jgi:hypothetical protein